MLTVNNGIFRLSRISNLINFQCLQYLHCVLKACWISIMIKQATTLIRKIGKWLIVINKKCRRDLEIIFTVIHVHWNSKPFNMFSINKRDHTKNTDIRRFIYVSLLNFHCNPFAICVSNLLNFTMTISTQNIQDTPFKFMKFHLTPFSWNTFLL